MSMRAWIAVALLAACGDDAPGYSTITIAPARVLADGHATATVIVKVASITDVPIPHMHVDFTSSDADDVFSPASTITDASAVAVATLRSHVGGTKTVTARVPGVMAIRGSVAFTALPAACTGLPTFTAMPYAANELGADYAVELADFDGDGVPDLASAPYTGAFLGTGLQLRHGNGDGTFAAATATPTAGPR